MKKLNLANKNNSDINYHISKFPDGQQSVRIIDEVYPSIQVVSIWSRMNSFRDIELILSARASLNEMGIKEIHLYVPYFLGARSDRKFGKGESNYLKDVICPIINLQNFESVTVLDPHSDVLEACLNNFKKESNLEMVGRSLAKINYNEEEKEKTVIVSPDAGAMKKIYSVSKAFEIKNVIIAAKNRDLLSGNITHTDVPGLNNYSIDSNFVIIDDICDGGRTFIEIAKSIRSHIWPRDEYFRGKIYLIVTHGIFSSGFLELSDYFDGIFTTDSARNIDVSIESNQEVSDDFLYQFLVF
jgi:ribose-phosphate pyrophosphokinase